MDISAAIFGFFAEWTPANWIAFGTAIASLLANGVTAHFNSKRGRAKNRREEFHRRIATPIEQALDFFATVHDDLNDALASCSLDELNVDELEKSAATAQRKLSRSLRLAASSAMCSDDGWNLGEEDYDIFITSMDRARDSRGEKRRRILRCAADALERQEQMIRMKIEEELKTYT